MDVLTCSMTGVRPKGGEKKTIVWGERGGKHPFTVPKCEKIAKPGLHRRWPREKGRIDIYERGKKAFNLMEIRESPPNCRRKGRCGNAQEGEKERMRNSLQGGIPHTDRAEVRELEGKKGGKKNPQRVQRWKA